MSGTILDWEIGTHSILQNETLNFPRALKGLKYLCGRFIETYFAVNFLWLHIPQDL